MGESLLIVLREGFEAALVVAIVFAYLRRTGRTDLNRATWEGVGLAAALATVVGVVAHLTIGGLEGAARLRAFAGVSLAAAAVLTWMVFWMRTQGRAIKGHLEHSIDEALHHTRHVGRAVGLVAFFAVLREGIETALFLLAATTRSNPGQVVLGGVLGLAIAAVLGWMVYAGGRVVPMRAFFTVTGVVVIVFAAGLCARAVGFLQASGDLGTFQNALYDLTRFHWLTIQAESGKFLAGLFGWDPRPSVEQALAWAGYLLPVTALFLRPHRGARPAPTTSSVATGRAAAPRVASGRAG